MYYGDINDETFLTRVLEQSQPSYILLTLTPDQYDESSYRYTYLQPLETLQRTLQRLPLSPLILFTSSTSIYGQNQGEWVDEGSDCNPSKFNGKILLEAELLLRNSTLNTCILRLSGLYDHRHRQQPNKSLKKRTPLQSRWVNRIHRDDVVSFIETLLQLSESGQRLAPLYLVSDSKPTPKYIAQELAESQPSAPLDKKKLPLAGRRCDNSLMLSTGYQLLYPDYRLSNSTE